MRSLQSRSKTFSIDPIEPDTVTLDIRLLEKYPNMVFGCHMPRDKSNHNFRKGDTFMQRKTNLLSTNLLSMISASVLTTLLLSLPCLGSERKAVFVSFDFPLAGSQTLRQPLLHLQE